MSQSILAKVLPKISSADDLHALCDQAFLYRELPSQSYPERFVSSFSSKLGCTKGELRQFVHQLSEVVMAAVMILSNPDHDPSHLDQIYPAKLSSKMKAALNSYLNAKFPDWKALLVSSNMSYPRYAQARCTVKEGGDNSQQKSCILELQIDNGSDTQAGDIQAGDTGMETQETVKMELDKDKLNEVLKGLSKIREQLQTVTQ